MTNSWKKKTPLLGWLFLLAAVPCSVVLLSLGGTEPLQSAFWGDGMMWGLGAVILFGGSFWIARLRHAPTALIIVVLSFLAVTVLSQVYFLEKAQSSIWWHVHEKNPEKYPDAWRSLDRTSLYNTWLQDLFEEPDVGGWSGHIRMYFEFGSYHWERAGPRRHGSGYAEVYRSGWEVVWGWFVSHIFLAAGFLMGLGGLAINTPRPEPDPERIFGKSVYRTLTRELQKKGVKEDDIRDILTASRDPQINQNNVRALLPARWLFMSESITADLRLAKHYASIYADDIIPSGDLNHRLDGIQKRYFGPYTGERKLRPHHFQLKAAEDMHAAQADVRLYECLKMLMAVSRGLKLGMHIPPFLDIDLSGIDYRKLSVGETWQPLVTNTSFYNPGSPWELLEKEPAHSIPEDAYLAIVYQAVTMPDQRVYEMWYGETPSVIVDRLGERLYDAILTFISSWRSFGLRPEEYHRAETAARIMVRWDSEKATPVIGRCIEAGWRGVVNRLPDTPYWRAFIERYEPTPFGELVNYTRFR